ncbi:MAG: Ig-like domain-containing protein [Opitutales bacterium]
MQVGSTYTLTASASSANGIATVEFYLNDQYIGLGKQQNNTNYYSLDIEFERSCRRPSSIFSCGLRQGRKSSGNIS